ALELDEYVELLIDFLQRTPADRVLQRVTAEAPAELLIAPLWPLHKARVHSALQREMERRNARQGRLCV
nr:TIGR01212 family radical SAM protein [bacterium]